MLCWLYFIYLVITLKGQQNDFILISLVRTKAVGHIRDIRRLVVAMSRARFGLYIFGRANLFRNCFELQPVFRLLMDRPQELHLLPDESFTCERLIDENVSGLQERTKIIHNMTEMADFVFKMYMTKVDAIKESMVSRRWNWSRLT